MKFKVGDRVAVYGWFTGSSQARAEIKNINGQDVRIQFEDGGRECAEVHYKQCRRLIKKPRRRVWLNIEEGGKTIVCCWRSHPHSEPGCVEFIEVKKRGGV